MYRTAKFLLGVCIGLIPFTSYAQLVTSFASKEVLATALMPASFLISDVSYLGYEYSYGYFNGTNTNIGINQGIIFTTGVITGVNGAQGPNDSPECSADLPQGTFMVEPLATWLRNEQATYYYNTSILSFVFSSPDTAVDFHYVFGSEEYNEYVGTQFGDIFALFVSNADSSNVENIAIVPGMDTAVCINTINNGYSTGCSPGSNATNPQYFFDNCQGQTIQYDGFTVPLTAHKSLIPNHPYRIWFVIADAGDGLYDSGVFIKGNHPNSGIAEEQAPNPYAFPNPSNGHITLSGLTQQSQVTIYNLAGQPVWQQTLTQTGNAEINLEHLAAGVYTLVQKTDKGVNSSKIILQK